MNISEIVSNLKAQADKNSEIELNNTLLSNAQLEIMSREFGLSQGSLITITGISGTDIPNPTGDSVTITAGTVKVLNQTSASITITFTAGTPDVDIVLYLKMPARWKFTDSFPDLTLFPFNLLEVSDVFFVYSTNDLTGWTIPGSGTMDLVSGLNYGSSVSITGFELISALLGDQMPAGSLSLTGTFSADIKYPYPVIELIADMGIPSFTIVPGLDLKTLGILLEITDSQDKPAQDFNFGIAAKTTDLEFDLLIMDGGQSISLRGGPRKGFQATLENLAKTELADAVIPGVDFSSFIPDPIYTVFAKDIEFNGFSIVLSLTAPRQISFISFSIGETTGTEIDLGLFKLTSFNFNASWINPGKPGALTIIDIKATGKVPIKVFKDDFNFEISIQEVNSKWAINSIIAGYSGMITMADILSEISPGSAIPDFLNHISFSDFQAHAEPGEDQFALSCKGAVGINFMDSDFAADFFLILNKNKSATTFELRSQFITGDFLFTLDILLADSTQSGSSFTVSGAAGYSGEKFDLDFKFSLEEKKATLPQTGNVYTIKLEYNAIAPPKLSDFLTWISDRLGLESEFPGGLQIDAELDAFTVIILKEGTDPVRMDAAALFKITIDSLIWNLYFSYTNDAYFESQGANSRAMSASNTPAYIFGVALSGDIGLNKLPLVGKIPGIGDLYIKKLGFYYTNAAFSSSLKKLIFTVAELGTGTPLAPNPDAAFLSQPGFTVMALFGNKNEDKAKPNSLPLPVYTPPVTGSNPPFQQTQSLPKDPISWLEINKTLGPVELIKIGFSYEKPADGVTNELGVAGLYVTGAFTVAGLSMVLDRLGVTFPIPKPGSGLNPLSQVGFHLSGMFLEYQTASFEIAGGFINLPGGSVNMIGEFIIKFGTFGIQAYGGYSNELSSPSLFIFLHLNAPLGGPPFFFITGVSGGFGVNRGFILPTFDQLLTYPLLPSSTAIPSAGDLAGKSSEDKLKAMTDALVSLAHYFPVEEGEYWFAVGLDVTCFEMISVSAVLSVAFGAYLEIGVVGSASMTIPVAEPEPIVFIQINFEVSYSTRSGLFAVMGVITPSSSIFAGLVHISGGFALYTWFSGEHSGDFVLTIGGYNAHYKRPDYYPDVPRMELRAGFGIVNLVGDSYFALLPTMLMAGMDIKATADLGPIAAWFDASLDFIFGWKPFHYEISASVEIGASFTIDLGFVKVKITIQVGVMLDVWGPEFGGKATVDLDIITFTIYFGADPKPAPDLLWSEFRQFLPSVKGDKAAKSTVHGMLMDAGADDPDTNPPLVNIMVKTGLQQQFEEGHEVDGLNWIVNANGFDIRTHSTAPVTSINYNGTVLPAATYNFLDPDNLNVTVKEVIDNKVPQPYFAYKDPGKDPIPATPWYQLSYGIPPMGLTNIQSTHIVNFHHLDEQGNIGSPVTDVIITLNTTGIPPSLWGNEPVKKDAVNSSKTVIQNSLVELSITPMIWFPKRTTFIPYYYLVFDTNNLFLEQDTEPEIKEPDYTKEQTQTIYTNMVNGSAFGTTLAVRSRIVTALTGIGFSNLALINSDHLSTQDYVDDPMLVYMSSTNETSLT